MSSGLRWAQARSAQQARRVLDDLTALGRLPEDVRAILLTHGHPGGGVVDRA